MTDWRFGLLRRNYYSVILCDWPWAFKTHVGDSVPQQAEVQHYPTIPYREGVKWNVADLARPDCALIMWSTSAHTLQCFAMAQRWGFEFKGKAFCWAKTNKLQHQLPDSIPITEDAHWFMGMGYGSRRNTEDAWLFTRGNPSRISKGVRELIVAPIREHSRKPDAIHDRIEALYPGPYAELFARSSRKGWSSFGNETGKF